MSSQQFTLKWITHKSTFFHCLSTIRSKESYCDVTLSCEGKFYPLHKFVLSTCSKYFEEMFEITPCKHPVVVLNNIDVEDFEALLIYMYVGEVNVVEEKLASLIEAAKCLRIKGLDVPDEEPLDKRPARDPPKRHHNNRCEESPRAKRRKRSFDTSIEDNVKSNNTNLMNQSNSRIIIGNNIENEREIPSADVAEHNNDAEYNIYGEKELPSEEVQQPEVKTVNPEPIDLSQADNKTNQHGLGFVDTQNYESYPDNDVDVSLLGNMDDSQNLPGESGYQGNSIPSMWEGDGSLSAFTEGCNADNSQNQQLATSSRERFAGYPGPSSDLSGMVLPLSERFPNRTIPQQGRSLFNCNLCSYQTSVKSGLNRHMFTHSQVKRFRCTLCSYATNLMYNLTTHCLNHTDEKRFQCNLCSFKCNHGSNLKTHKLVHHSQTL